MAETDEQEIPAERVLIFYRNRNDEIVYSDFDGTDPYERRLAVITLRDPNVVWMATRSEVKEAWEWRHRCSIEAGEARWRNDAPSTPRTFTITGPTVEVSLPPRFYEDHVQRGCNPGEVIRWGRTAVRVLLDRDAFDDLMSDARYYADEATSSEPELRGIAASAAATVRRLTTAGRP